MILSLPFPFLSSLYGINRRLTKKKVVEFMSIYVNLRQFSSPIEERAHY